MLKSFLTILFLVGPTSLYAANGIDVPFKIWNQKVIAKIEKSRCTIGGKNPLVLRTVTPEKEYKLVCDIRDAKSSFESDVPIVAVENFEYPKTILDEINSTNFDEVKKRGEKAIKKKTRKWGTEYSWQTPTKGTKVYSYLCPTKSSTCFKATHGGTELFSFRLESRDYSKYVSCYMPSKEGNLVSSIELCAEKDRKGNFKIPKTVMEKIKFDDKGLAGGSIADEGCFWLTKKGLLRKTHCHDNGADEFQDGLARYVDSKGKFGFMDERLQIKIASKYDFAFPFQFGQSRVCNGCKVVSGEDPEHSKVEGGDWMEIDKSGKVIPKAAN